jgi:hypothetical protein
MVGRSTTAEEWGPLILIVVAMISASAYLASRDSTAEILGGGSVLDVTGMIALGPAAGWFLAAKSGHVVSALWSLIPATVFSVGPLLLWFRVRAVFLLVVAAFAWVASGYFYSVVMWI